VFDQIRRLLKTPELPGIEDDDLKTAVAVLLVEAARTDGVFNRHERATIERLLERRFELSEAASEELLSHADETASRPHELLPFTKLAVEHMEPQRRVRLIEMLWEVAFADDKLDPHEEALLHRVAGMTGVADAECEAAKHRMLRWLQQKRNR
jgi:uncharacterized tellurite resistance protein B-like protein